jgi:hypothetical protein
MEKYPQDFDYKPNDLTESVSRGGSSNIGADESKELATGHKFFSKLTLINYFPKYKLKRSGKF